MTHRTIVISALPEPVLDRAQNTLAARPGLVVRRVESPGDPPALLVRSGGEPGTAFDTVRETLAEAVAGHACDLGWAGLDDFTVIGRGNGADRLLEIGAAPGNGIAAVSIVEMKGGIPASDRLLVWAATPEAMAPVKRLLLGVLKD